MADELFWADQHARVTMLRKKKSYTCASGVTPSGPKHVGSFREVVTSYFIHKSLVDAGTKARLIYSWDSYDRFRKVPSDVPADKFELLKSEIGKPVCDVIDPWSCHKSWAHHWIAKLEAEVKRMGLVADYIYQHEAYRACKYKEGIKTALLARERIIDILSQYRSSELTPDWWPVHVYCSKCGKDSTHVIGYDGEYVLGYSCDCGFSGKTDFSKTGNVKLSWRVDWPMRWQFEGVDFEPAGKDHMVAGSSYDTGKIIAKEVFGYEPPYGIMYDYVGAKGGSSKMSASAGGVIYVSDVLEVYLPEIVFYMFSGTKPNKEMRISFDEDVIKIYEDFYACENACYGEADGVNDKRASNLKRIYQFCVKDPAKKKPAQLGFRTAALIVQTCPEGEWLSKVKEFIKVSKSDEPRLLEVLNRAKFWVDNYAPESYKIVINDVAPKLDLPSNFKKALHELGAKLLERDYSEEELNTLVFGYAKELGVNDFFKACYQLIISKEKGPKLAQFILSAGRARIGNLLSNT